MTLRIEPDVRGTLTLDLKEQPWQEALAGLLFAARLHAVEEEGSELRIAARPLPGTPFAPPAPPEPESPGPETTRPAWPERRIDVDVEAVELGALMRRIGAEVGVTIEVDPDVHEQVSVALRDIPWREAVDVIARLSHCEVAERGSALLLHQCSLIRVQFTQARASTVLQLLAAYGGVSLVIAPELGASPVSVDWRFAGIGSEADWLWLVRPIARVVGLVAERRGTIVVVSARTGWGASWPPDEAPPEPTSGMEASAPTRFALRARGAPLDPLLRALAASLDLDYVAGADAAVRVDASGDGDANELLRLLEREAGAETLRDGGLLELRRARGGPPQGVPAKATLACGDGRTCAIDLEATLVGPDAWNLAIVGGRGYRPGEALLDPAGDPLPVRVVAIDADGVTFRAEGRPDQRLRFP